MEAKEKASELVDKFYPFCKGDSPNGSLEQDDIDTTNNAKQCALIAIDFLLSNSNRTEEPVTFWRNVKTEIQNL